MRLYEMFIGDFEKSRALEHRVHQGLPPLFGARVELWRILLWTATAIPRSWRALMHRTIKKVTEDIEMPQDEHRHRRHDEPAQRDL